MTESVTLQPPLSHTARWLLGAIFLLALAAFVIRVWRGQVTVAGDFLHNYQAALKMRQGESIYDLTIADRFSTAASMPSTLLFVVPFTYWPVPVALWLYRFVTVIVSALGVALAVQTLPPSVRTLGAAGALLAMLTFYSFILSFQVGQFHMWVMLGLGLGIWAAQRGRWALVGAAFGLAMMLKVSPALLLVYCALWRKWRALAAAVGVVLVMVVASLVVGRQPNDWLIFLSSLPRLSASTLAIANQSLPAFVARQFTPVVELNPLDNPLGSFSALAYVIAPLAVVLVWQAAGRIGDAAHPLALSVLILAALLAGPYNFAHYTDWAIIALVQFAHPSFPRRWWPWLLLGVVLLALPPPVISSASLAAWPVLRLCTGPMTLGYAVCFILGYVWLRRWPHRPAARWSQ